MIVIYARLGQLHQGLSHLSYPLPSSSLGFAQGEEPYPYPSGLVIGHTVSSGGRARSNHMPKLYPPLLLSRTTSIGSHGDARFAQSAASVV